MQPIVNVMDEAIIRLNKVMKNECICPSCKWEGNYNDCKTKHFGEYCGDKNEPPEMWGWEEWDDLVCPKCEAIITLK